MAFAVSLRQAGAWGRGELGSAWVGGPLVTPLPPAVSWARGPESRHHPLESPRPYLSFFFRASEQEQGAF